MAKKATSRQPTPRSIRKAWFAKFCNHAAEAEMRKAMGDHPWNVFLLRHDAWCALVEWAAWDARVGSPDPDAALEGIGPDAPARAEITRCMWLGRAFEEMVKEDGWRGAVRFMAQCIKRTDRHVWGWVRADQVPRAWALCPEDEQWAIGCMSRLRAAREAAGLDATAAMNEFCEFEIRQTLRMCGETVGG